MPPGYLPIIKIEYICPKYHMKGTCAISLVEVLQFIDAINWKLNLDEMASISNYCDSLAQIEDDVQVVQILAN